LLGKNEGLMVTMVAADHNSAFPAGVNVAATFSRRLMRLRGEALGAEFRGKGVDVMLGPASGPLGRVPQGGRNWEAFGPDPYLAGVAMAETIQGIQSRGVVACAKHYILNEQEHFRGSMDVRIDDRTMHELYLWPFADAVRAGVGSVMCSYNKINGTYACENEWTTNYLLKNELAFQGFGEFGLNSYSQELGGGPANSVTTDSHVGLGSAAHDHRLSPRWPRHGHAG
jgi:beta-glucosidase